MSTEMILRSLDDVTSLAQIAIASKLTKLSRVEEAAVILMTGRELGLQPMQSLRGIYVVDGKPTLSADMMVAVIRGSGLCESWCVVESTAERCTITTRRRGEQHDATRTWTRADADRAGVTGKDTWRKYPAAMLRHRCASDLARQEYPDVLLGLYDPEELGADATSVQQPSAVGIAVATPTLPAPPTWAEDLAACVTLRDVRACYTAAASTDRDTRAQADDVRAWLAEHNVIATAAEVTALLATLPDDALVILDDIHADEEHPVPVRIERVARRVARTRSTWDAHSADVASKIVARSYAHATGTDLKAAGAALKRAIESGEDPDPTPPTGTDGPAREPGSDDGDDGSAAAYEAHRAAQGERAQVTELRVVRDHTDEELITSEAAWAAYLATCNAFRTRHAFRNLTGEFVKEGVFVRREKAALARIEALGFRDPRGWLYAPPENQKKRRNEAA